MSCNLIKLNTFIDFNPRRIIRRNNVAPYVEMAAIPKDNRDIEYVFHKEFKGSGSKFKNGDTLFARITPCLQNGKTSKVDCLDDDVIAHGSTEFIVFSAKEPEFDEDFVYYLCRWDKFRNFAKSRMEGTSGRQRVDWKVVAESEWKLPNKKIRKKIGFILKQLDDKISNNNHINKTLEEIAQALFKSWFVDFEPVKAKIQAKEKGEDPQIAAMCAISGKSAQETGNFIDSKYDKLRATADLFPDKFAESELGLIPEGWEVDTIGNLYNTKSGGTPSRSQKQYYDKGDILWVKSKELSNTFVFDTEEKITLEAISKSSAKEIDPFSVLIAMYGATVGKMTILGNKATCNQAICAVTKKYIFDYSYLYLYLTENRDELMSRASGSAQQNISQIIIKQFHILKPPNELVNLFQKRVNVFFLKVLSNSKENDSIAKTRDELLPKLLNRTYFMKGVQE